MKKRIKLSSLISMLALVLFASCTKNVVPDIATNITLNKTSLSLILGQSDSLYTTITSTGDIKNLTQTWTTNDPSIATVTNGIVTGVRVGTAIITVTSGTKTATCQVSVDDKILPVLTQGELLYYGDVYKTGISNNFLLFLASSGINIDTNSGNGEILIIELNATMSVKDSIPQGTYDMITDTNILNNFAPFSLVPAYVDSTGTPWGCWYFGFINDPFSVGSIIVTRSINVYTISYNFIDDYGVTISGTYQGLLSYKNYSSQASQTMVKNKMKYKLKSKINFNKTMKFKRR